MCRDQKTGSKIHRDRRQNGLTGSHDLVGMQDPKDPTKNNLRDPRLLRSCYKLSGQGQGSTACGCAAGCNQCSMRHPLVDQGLWGGGGEGRFGRWTQARVPLPPKLRTPRIQVAIFWEGVERRKFTFGKKLSDFPPARGSSQNLRKYDKFFLKSFLNA